MFGTWTILGSRRTHCTIKWPLLVRGMLVSIILKYQCLQTIGMYLLFMWSLKWAFMIDGWLSYSREPRLLPSCGSASFNIWSSRSLFLSASSHEREGRWRIICGFLWTRLELVHLCALTSHWPESGHVVHPPEGNWVIGSSSIPYKKRPEISAMYSINRQS